MTVVKLDEEEKGQPAGADGSDEGMESAGSMRLLVDAQDNQYALIRPRDTTAIPEDLGLLNDLLLTWGACFAISFLCRQLGYALKRPAR
jgi:hypothetical protein